MSKFRYLYFLLLSCAGWAQPLDRQRLNQLLLENQPRLQAAQLEVQALERLVEQADVSPNPVLAAAVEVPAFRQLSRAQLTVSQVLELGGKREARVRLAQAQAREAEARQLEIHRQLLQQGQQTFADLLWAELRLRLESEAEELAQRQYTVAQKRFELGDAAEIETIELRAEHSRRRAQVQLARAEEQGRRDNLAQLLRLPPAQLQVQGALGAATPPPPLEELFARADEIRPDLTLARLTQTRREAEVRLEESRGVSDLTVQAGVAYDRTLITPVNQTGGLSIGAPVLSLLAGLSLPLPFNDTNQGNIEAARARLQGAGAELSTLQRQYRLEIQSAHWQVLANQAARRTLKEQTLPLLRRALSVLEQAYAVGARTMMEVVSSRQAYLEARREELQAARDEEHAWIRLETATFQQFAR